MTVASSLIPIKLIGVLIATNTLWGLLFDAFVVGVKLTKTMIILAFCALIGVILVVNPSFILSYFGVKFITDENSQVFVKDFFYYFGVFLGLSGAFMGVLINWLISDMVKFIHPVQSAFYSMFSKAVISAFFILGEKKDGPWLFQDYIYLSMFYCSESISQLCLYYCNKYEKR